MYLFSLTTVVRGFHVYVRMCGSQLLLELALYNDF